MSETVDIKIHEFPIVNSKEIQELTPTYKDLTEKAISYLLDPENRGVIITGNSYTGKSFLRDSIMANWDKYTERLTSKTSKTLFARVSNFTKLKGIPAMQESVAGLKVYAENEGYTNLCMILDEPVSAHVLQDLGVSYLLEADTFEMSEFFGKISRKIHDACLIDMNTVTLPKEELIESIYLRRNYKSVKGDLKITRTHVKYFVDELDAIMLDIYGDPIESFSPGIPSYIFNKLAFSFIVRDMKLTKSSIIEYLNTEGAEELSNLVAQSEDIAGVDDFEEEITKMLEQMGVPKENIIRTNTNLPGQTAGVVPVEAGLALPDLEFNNPKEISKKIQEVVLGQKEAIESLSDALKMPAAGLKLTDDRGPIATYFFAGPTGVGKTETARVLAKHLYKGEEVPLMQLDLSEYSEKHEAQKLYGAPAGYLGYQDGGILTNMILENPRCVLLLDEADKAHPLIWDKFLQVFEDGRMTDNTGRVVDFTNVVIIITSNVGAMETQRRPVGFGASAAVGNIKETRLIVQAAIEKMFRPEFLNRIDRFIIFGPISQEDGRLIVKKYLKDLFSVLEDKKGIKTLMPGDEFFDYVLERSDFRKMGGRNVKKNVKSLVGGPIADKIIDNPDSKKLALNLDGDKVTVS